MQYVFTMYTVHCTCAFCNIHVQCTLYNVECTYMVHLRIKNPSLSPRQNTTKFTRKNAIGNNFKI